MCERYRNTERLKRRVWIGRLRTPRLLRASDGTAVPMTTSGWLWRKGIFWKLAGWLGSLIVFGVILLILSIGLARTGQASELPITGTASWYSTECCKYNTDPRCPTASGRGLYELERSGIDFAAAWEWPLGAKLKVTNAGNGKSVEVRVLDRGPKKSLRRIIDLSRRSFSKIADPDLGTVTVKVEVMP
ncbi:MAG: septal ring lytic transglycosylase RlpA family protein [Syntrophorhabdus sp.]